MGFYIRKWFGLGPLRLNVSKSGLGVSAGVRGARVGLGPRGYTVHLGRHGLYYRATIGRGRTRLPNGTEAGTHPKALSDPAPEQPRAGDPAGHTREIQSALATVRRARFWLLLAAVLASVWVLTVDSVRGVWLLVPVGFLVARSLIRRIPFWRIEYAIEPELLEAYDRLSRAVSAMGRAGALWGGDTPPELVGAILRGAGTIHPGCLPGWMKVTGASPISLEWAHGYAVLMPDGLLLADGTEFGWWPMDLLTSSVGVVLGAAAGQVPASARILRHEWVHSTKHGKRDLRYRDNREMAICQLPALALTANGRRIVTLIGLAQSAETDFTELNTAFTGYVRYLGGGDRLSDQVAAKGAQPTSDRLPTHAGESTPTSSGPREQAVDLPPGPGQVGAAADAAHAQSAAFPLAGGGGHVTPRRGSRGLLLAFSGAVAVAVYFLLQNAVGGVPSTEAPRPEVARTDSARSVPSNELPSEQPRMPRADPSFSCEGRLSPDEAEVCASEELASLDWRLDTLYRQALVSSTDRDAIRRAQRAWVLARRTCMVGSGDSPFTCLRDTYERRIEEVLIAQVASKVPAGRSAEDALTAEDARARIEAAYAVMTIGGLTRDSQLVVSTYHPDATFIDFNRVVRRRVDEEAGVGMILAETRVVRGYGRELESFQRRGDSVSARTSAWIEYRLRRPDRPELDGRVVRLRSSASDTWVLRGGEWLLYQRVIVSEAEPELLD